jgi:hypothetical protein
LLLDNCAMNRASSGNSSGSSWGIRMWTSVA